MRMRTALVLVVAMVIEVASQSAMAFYNPSTGRWLSRDPVGERGGANEHALLKNQPINHFDILGLSNQNDPPISIEQPIPNGARFATRSIRKKNTGSISGLCYVTILWDVAITDAKNIPVPGVTVDEGIKVLSSENFIRLPVLTGSGVTSSDGKLSDVYLAWFLCCRGPGYVSIRQTILTGIARAFFYTTIRSNGDVSGNLRSVFVDRYYPPVAIY